MSLLKQYRIHNYNIYKQSIQALHIHHRDRTLITRFSVGMALLTALSLVFFFATDVGYANDDRHVGQQAEINDADDLHFITDRLEQAEGILPLGLSAQWMTQSDSTVYYDDLTIKRDEIYTGDIIVTSGDVRLETDSVVRGGLVVYSGDIVLEADAIVEGDVIALSGDARIAGEIRGALVIWSGDVDLQDGATVHGDVSVMSGTIDRSAQANVLGNIIAGPALPQLPTFLEGLDIPNIPNMAAAPSTIIEAAPPNVRTTTTSTTTTGWNQVGRFVLRLIGATFLTAIIVLITGLVYYLQPTFIQGLRTTISTQKPTSFVIGLLLNVVLSMLIMATFGTGSVFTALCLAPLSFVALLLFLILNTGGWAALSIIVGERLLSYLKMSTHQLTALLIGATAMTGTITAVWALGSCMRPVAYLGMLTLTALGGGSLIVQQFQKKRDGDVAVA